MAAAPTLYIFLDEGGNFDFSPSGTKYFTLTAVSLLRPFRLHTALDTYKYDLIEYRIKPRVDLEYFHCSEDNRHVRARVFAMLADELPNKTIDAVVVEKSKVGPAMRAEEVFYPRMLGYLLKFAIERADESVGEVVVITDTIPVAKKRRAVEKAVKVTLKGMLPQTTPYRIMHHASRSHYGLQVADYINWAIFRKWEKADNTHHKIVCSKIRSEFDIFRRGTRHYYEL